MRITFGTSITRGDTACGTIRLAAICAVLALGCAAEQARAVASRDLDVLPDDVVAPAVQVFETKARPKPEHDPALAAPTGNPLWSVPLSKLSATRDRPVFSASRRPPPQAVVAPVAVEAAKPVPVALPEPLNLTLVGAVVGDSDAIAVFIDRANHGTTIRMRPGDTRGGWQLRSILGREATLKNGDRTEVLVLLKPGAAAEPAAPAAVPIAGGSGSMVYGNSFAPFIPRSTPKHGEPDGL